MSKDDLEVFFSEQKVDFGCNSVNDTKVMFLSFNNDEDFVKEKVLIFENN